jgi:hypothetical protein
MCHKGSPRRSSPLSGSQHSGIVAILTAVLALTVPARCPAQEPVGVVTNADGSVTVSRAALPQPAPLRFRDKVFVQDRIATGASAIARILLGGRAIVTVREHSTVTITESPNVSTVTVGQGRIAVAVARERMGAGDVVEVRTPNAVAGIRGTVIVAEVRDPTYSTITVLKGVIDVHRLRSGQTIGLPMILNKQERVVIADGNAPLPRAETIPIDVANRLRDDFRLAPARNAPAAATAAVIEDAIQQGLRLLTEESSESSRTPVAPTPASENTTPLNTSTIESSAGGSTSTTTTTATAGAPTTPIPAATTTTTTTTSTAATPAGTTATVATAPAATSTVTAPTMATAPLASTTSIAVSSPAAPTISNAAVPTTSLPTAPAAASTPAAFGRTSAPGISSAPGLPSVSPILGGGMVSGTPTTSIGVGSTSSSAKSQSVLGSVIEKASSRDALKAARSGSDRGKH